MPQRHATAFSFAFAALVLAGALAAALAAGPVRAETHLVGPGGRPAALAEVLARAKDGDVIDLLPGRYLGEVAVIPPRRLTLRGVGARPVFEAMGKSAERKATWVVKGGDITVENVEFRGARAPDGNGAGIRHEAGRLTVRRSAFFDNESGILTANQPEMELVVEDSEFGEAPRVEGGLHHLLYVGRIGRFTLTGSRLHNGFEGHLVKSRARENTIAYNLIWDGEEGGASYEIDLPNGGLAWVIGNVIGQSARTQNRTVLSFGAEGRPHEKNGLYLSHNTFVSEPGVFARFLRVWRENLGEGTELRAVNNVVIGLGVFEAGNGEAFAGNRWAPRRRMLESVYTLEFGLVRDSEWRGSAAPAGSGGGRSLVPAAQFRLPVGTQPLEPRSAWSPGAVQD